MSQRQSDHELAPRCDDSTQASSDSKRIVFLRAGGASLRVFMDTLAIGRSQLRAAILALLLAIALR